MPWQFAHYYGRQFQALFFGMEYHLQEAKELYSIIHSWNLAEPNECDQNIWMKEKTTARASFIMGIAGIEAFANNVLNDFGVLTKEQIPCELLNKNQQRNKMNYWRLPDKVYFLPSLCKSNFVSAENYFDRNAHEFQLFEELVSIRNSIVHGKPKPWLGLIKLNPDKRHELIDNFEINKWPISKIFKDFSSFNYDCAKTARDDVVWIKDSLSKFIEGIDEKYFREEKFKLISHLIEGDDTIREELLNNWRKYVETDEQFPGGSGTLSRLP
jgi:hypothetical protein